MQKKFLVTDLVSLIVLVGIGIWAFAEVEHDRIESPYGEYTAIITCRRWVELVPVFPGGGGDRAGVYPDRRFWGHGLRSVPVGDGAGGPRVGMD